ncbi:NAD(P)H-dependent oxidoreductase [Croceitalea rosinachiae]|uniref:NAD(P)H-dependent oxidoreductase n=1 Tax=Croceitalea rosinachiae TaxID=3075596 RepID=A0ABU3AEL9_9FLAO|nr:NAD(P)H-dependent oxidoreductase [Croceitalea sp. F388]MDT0608373.1 NAD(P)H-dependent oxidoreductase [Croceitalea sp. F388]
MNNILENRTWRYATKKFDSTKKVSDKDLELLLEATRLSSSSYGLQPYHVFIITDQAIKEKLKPVSWGQSQITDASHLIIFANQTNFGGELVDDYLNNLSKVRNVPLENLKGYSDFAKSKIVDLPEEVKTNWTAKQVYIALGNLMQAAAELKIDTCPMEGFEPEKYNEILGLIEKGLNASVALPIGYRSDEDETQHYAKVRKSKEELFTYI